MERHILRLAVVLSTIIPQEVVDCNGIHNNVFQSSVL